MSRFVVIPCGGAKLDHVAQARDLYTGSMFRDALGTALQLVNPEQVLILSAKYGLVHLNHVLSPYNVKMGDATSVPTDMLTAQLRYDGVTEVLSLLPKAYLAALQAAADTTITIDDAYLGCRGIGEQKGRLAQLRRNAQQVAA